MRDGDLVKWVRATGRAHKGETSTYANVPLHTHSYTHSHTHTHTHKMTETVPSCVPTASFPSQAPNHTSLTYWKHPVAPLSSAPPYPEFWVKGVRRP